MTAKKAIQILDYIIECKSRELSGSRDPKQPWNQGSGVANDLVKVMNQNMANELKLLRAIRKELVPNCKHPKEMIQPDPETKEPYCMNCNMDL